MSIPNLPPFYAMKWVTVEDELSPDAALYMDESALTLDLAMQLLNSLSLSDTVANGTIVYDGLIAPSKSTTEINSLEPSAPVGTMWFDTTIAKLKVKTAASVVETITSS